MSAPHTSVPTRNQSMECFKMIASILVVLLHQPFPGQLGTVVSVVGSIAVPMFFTITGYFNYGADREAVLRRLKHLLRLYLIVIVTTAVCGVVSTELQGGSSVAYLRSFLPDLEEIAHLLILHRDPRNMQLWYLISVCFCYLSLLLYLDFRGGKTTDYRPLYIIGACQFSTFLFLGCLADLADMEVPYLLWFNGYYFGICFFALGIFLHQYQQQILENFHLTVKKLWLLFLFGLALSFLQDVAIGTGQIPLGGFLEIIAFMLLMISHPVLTDKPGFLSRCIGKFGSWSTYVYLLHVIVIVHYPKLLQPSLTALLGNPQLEAYLTPLIVAGLSLLVAVAFTFGERLCRSLPRRR